MPTPTPDAIPLAPRKRPTQARARARVKRILDATRELVETRPLSAVTTTAIAERAALPVGSLYQYFPNRLAILAELARKLTKELDDTTIAALQETHQLSWHEIVDRVVDATLAGHRRNSQCVAIFRSLPPTPEFRAIATESNRRLAEALADHPVLRAQGRPGVNVGRVAEVAITAADAVERLAVAATDPAESEAIADEMKKLLKAYLGLYLTDFPADEERR